jgi:hypothetical protein
MVWHIRVKGMEFDLTYDPPATAACETAMPGRVRGSMAIHPRHGPALVTCFHGPSMMSHCCPCGNKHQAFVYLNDVGFPVHILEVDQRRDVAWVSRPQMYPEMNGFARNIDTNAPKQYDFVIVSSSVGKFLHVVADLLPREPVPGSPLELQLQPACFGPPIQQRQDAIHHRSFDQGQSGSPVLNLNNVVIAIVRNTGGRCGLLRPDGVL